MVGDGWYVKHADYLANADEFAKRRKRGLTDFASMHLVRCSVLSVVAYMHRLGVTAIHALSRISSSSRQGLLHESLSLLCQCVLAASAHALIKALRVRVSYPKAEKLPVVGKLPKCGIIVANKTACRRDPREAKPEKF